ncbi:hypothetical protein ALC53_07880 [Atta colombica]|uniref:Uncharacterized protein n=1 Tax=Atta colombica TaxID=520822 RepID=A0A195BBX0_9HYME|nr:hypothetical protein ALC53_07880 [Atta colombica]
MKVTADISLSLLTTIMSPRRSNLEHFTRDTRSLPVGLCTRHAWQGCIYSQDCARLLDKHDRATHDWGSLIEHLEMNNGWHEILETLPNIERNKSRPFLFIVDVLACLIPSSEGFTAFREHCRRRCELARKLGVRYLVQVEQKGRKKEDSRRNKEDLPRTVLREASSEEERWLKSLPTR